ncbi:AfsR/SARP family transcriptional regulator [Streptomyces albireticuli]|uniref:Transcriptional regulator n=1 Tax=Streptomyces albireticuli TaxID=1940 RepID=A0A2A2D2F9_9ACTN|nr:BTAD domain-containing putative transcriptional regulator [Streptomyces albireticuli]MCD9144229.1 SARP family transcriptional regulator [Streptomyces albireticuli]MCD9162128.1 SARP family transcriptional regulator [Streptomyces albireticuli]MCD9193866.1 SARP family transcriptional regulator [Streptomyces albireticuli]PAU45647.1 transcriptional regulator [Streptomyces albireticuli]
MSVLRGGTADIPAQRSALPEQPLPPAPPVPTALSAPPEPPRLALQLLGGFRLTRDGRDGRDVELPAGAQRLVAVLALRGRLSRSRLAGTLWPETEEHRALARLRTAIWRVNQAAPRLVVSSGAQVALHARADVDVAVLVDHALRVFRGGEADPAAAWSPEGTGADLLPDWADEWLTHDRERLRQMRLHVLERMVESLCEGGRFGLAIEIALRVLRADVLRESAHRALVRAHLAEGNVGEAVRAYQACVEILRRELGVGPSRATSELLAGRALGRTAASRGPEPAVPTAAFPARVRTTAPRTP